MHGLLVTGTDTGVGKTTVAVGILRLAFRKSLRLVPFKPVETGCSSGPDDARRLCAAAALPGLNPSDVCPFPLRHALAPSVAARLAGVTISTEDLLRRARDLAARGDALLVETAGGLLTPYGPGITSATLAELFDMDVLIVAANRLGTINHTALTLHAVRSRGLRLAGLILSDISTALTADRPFNAGEIAAQTGVEPLGTLRYCASVDPDQVADAAQTDLNLSGILAGALI
jgi:dethiobiotin synthetase